MNEQKRQAYVEWNLSSPDENKDGENKTFIYENNEAHFTYTEKYCTGFQNISRIR
jgi:hypothetical protein